MRLFYSATSPYARKVAVLLVEAGHSDAVELVSVSGTPVDPGTMPVAQNPLGKIPALERSDGPAIRDAMREVTNAPGEPVGPGDFAKAKELIAAGTDIDYQGAAGNHEFDENGDVTGIFEHWAVKDGTIVSVEMIE